MSKLQKIMSLDSKTRLEAIVKLRDGYDIDVKDDGSVVYTITPEKLASLTRRSYESRVNALVREKYTLSQELAILRQRDSKPEEYAAYNAYCEQCKAIVRAEIYGDKT